MGEVLAHAAAFFEERLNRSSHLGRFGVETKILVDSPREIARRFEQRTRREKRVPRIVRQLRIRRHAFGIEYELVGVPEPLP